LDTLDTVSHQVASQGSKYNIYYETAQQRIVSQTDNNKRSYSKNINRHEQKAVLLSSVSGERWKINGNNGRVGHLYRWHHMSVCSDNFGAVDRLLQLSVNTTNTPTHI